MTNCNFVYDPKITCMIGEDEPSETCDKLIRKGKCDKKAYMEVYWTDNNGNRLWSYLCKKHYYIDRIKNFIFCWRNWYCDLDE